MKREHVIIALVILIVVALFLLPLAVGGRDGRANPEDSGGIEALQGALSNLPGFGTPLDAQDVRTSCFDRTTQTFTGPVLPNVCSFDVPEGIDVVPLRVIEGSCSIRISRQPDTFDQKTTTLEWTSNEKDLTLVGDGARITISGACRLRLTS